MSDPYVTLGVSRGASDKEIKKAYRQMSKKYHPDSYTDPAQKEWAEDQFQMIQEAYNRIVDERSGKSTGGYRSQSYGYGSSRTNSQDEQYYMAASNYIRAGKYNEALNVLNGIADHDGRWYYFCSVANLGVGNTAVAMDYAKRAVNLDPGNPQYQQWNMKLQQGTATPYGFGSSPFGGGYGGYGAYGGYGNYGGTRGYSSGGCSSGNLCLDLWCLESMCRCFCI